MDCTQNGYHLFPLVQVLQNGVSKYDILYLKPHRACQPTSSFEQIDNSQSVSIKLKKWKFKLHANLIDMTRVNAAII